MNIIKKIVNKYYEANGRPITAGDRSILDMFGIDAENTPRKAISQITYYTCLKVLSEAMGKMPLKLYQKTEDGVRHPAVTDTLRLLSTRPNPYMSATTFWTWCETCCQHYGNAYIWVDGELKLSKFGGSYVIKGFYPMNPEYVTVYIRPQGLFGTTDGIYYGYTNPDTGETYKIEANHVLHFKTWYSKDGVLGLPVREILKDTIDGAGYAESYETELYKNGMSAKYAMQYSGILDDERVKETQKKFADKLSGLKAAGKVIPIPAAFNLVPLTQSLVDSDFATLKRYSALQIAAAFGVKNSALNSYESSKYASVETENLAFLDTLSYRLKMYEDEINAKLLTPEEYKNGYYYKFNEQAILRTDSKTKAEILTKYQEHGDYTQNEVREFLDKPPVEGGDIPLINGSYLPSSKAGMAYDKNTDNGGKNK